MPITRPAHPTRDSVDGVVRKAILRWAATHHTPPELIFRYYREDEGYGDILDALAAVEQRYGLSESLPERWHGAIRRYAEQEQEARLGFAITLSHDDVRSAIENHGAEEALNLLPDEEFLTALELTHDGYFTPRNARGRPVIRADSLLAYTSRVLTQHGLPWEVRGGRIEWVGDRSAYDQTVAPALRALTDPRLAGARGEFEEALKKRRLGGTKNFEDAIDEAAKAVESVLVVLIAEHQLAAPKKLGVRSLFGTLEQANVLPGYLEALVCGSAGLRNHLASHGTGATPRAVESELADAALGGAATAVALLVHYLK